MVAAYHYVSADSHLEIDSRYWAPRVAAPHRERVPRLIRLPDGSDAWLVEGRPLREVPWDLYGGKGRDRWSPIGQNYETTPGADGDPAQRVRLQDEDGIDAIAQKVRVPPGRGAGQPLRSALFLGTGTPKGQAAVQRNSGLHKQVRAPVRLRPSCAP